MVTNFDVVLEPGHAEQALQAMKDPYIFDFLKLAEDAREHELEQALVDDIQKFLIGLGAGFAFYGRQKALVVGDEEFFPDLLFYHHSLRRFVVIELKIGKFKPEYVGKMNFYLNAVDEQLRVLDDRESVGIILCAGGDATVAKLALHRVYAPIAVSTWKAGTRPPALPDVEIRDDIPEDLAGWPSWRWCAPGWSSACPGVLHGSAMTWLSSCDALDSLNPRIGRRFCGTSRPR